MTTEEKRKALDEWCEDKNTLCRGCPFENKPCRFERYTSDEIDKAYDEVFPARKLLLNKDALTDNVNHPSHYETGKFECIDVMIETQGIEAVKGFCICNAFKYLYRAQRKNGLEDYKKAKWYIEKYIELEGIENDT